LFRFRHRSQRPLLSSGFDQAIFSLEVLVPTAKDTEAPFWSSNGESHLRYGRS
jgi:hypothetical protein